MADPRPIRLFVSAVVVGLLAAAACGGQDPSPPEAASTTAPAPAPAATVDATQATTPDPAPAPPAEPAPDPTPPEVAEDPEVEEGPAAGPAAAPEPAEAADGTSAGPAATPEPADAAEGTAPESRSAEPPDPEDPDAPDEAGASGGSAVELEGRWEGGISVSVPDLPFAVDLTASGDGLRGTIDIQGNFGLPLSNVTLDAGRLHFELESPLGLAVWDGEVGDGVIEGDFTQAGMVETFWMQRFEHPSEGEGASYRREEMTFSNGDIVLAGELTFPEGDGPHPAVVLISGSGDQDRDSEVAGFRLFAVLANHLAGAGVASLRFDDRGVGGSGGDGLEATLQDRAGDVEAAVDVLRARDDIAAGRIGLVGHSEGGLVAPVVAGRIDGVAFVALLAAPVLPLADILVEQQIVFLEESGATATEVEQSLALQESVFGAVATGQGWDEVEASLRSQIQQEFEAFSDEMREAIPDQDAMIDSIVDDTLASWQSPWFASFLEHDPRPPIVALDVPVLALFGELDTQVAAAGNSIAMSEAIAESSAPGYTIATILSANHLFQEAVTGSVNEYARLKREFAPDFIEIFTDWLGEFTGP